MDKRVLVVDDDADVRAVVIAALTDAGYDCFGAVDGAEGLRLAQAQPPDVVVLDIVMPQLSGDEVHRALRRDVATRYIPVIFLTARTETKDKTRRLLDGADDYMTKPFDTEELAARVTAAVRRATDLRALTASATFSAAPSSRARTASLERRSCRARMIESCRT